MKRMTRLMTRMMATGALAVMMTATVGHAAEPQGWKGEVTPYAWLAGVEGDVTVEGHKADFNKSFSDLFSAVKLGGSLLGVVQYNRFLLWEQIDYLKLSTSKMDTDKQPQHGNIDAKMLLNEVAVGYQVDGWMAGQTFDLLVGVRTLSLDTDLTVNGVGTFSKKVTAVDPIFVVRPSILIFPSVVKGLRFNPTLAIGGGGDSKLVYEMQPQLQYQITDNVAARIGYRRVGYKLDGKNNSDNKLNFDMAGMIFGVGVTF